jgi:hypothetical protein
LPGDGWLGGDAIDDLVEHEGLGVGGVTGKDVGEVPISDHHGKMMRGVARR